MTRQFNTGEWFIAKEDIVSKNNVVVQAGEEARIMIFDPAKEAAPYGIRRADGHIICAYVNETVMLKNPSRAHETPVGVSW